MDKKELQSFVKRFRNEGEKYPRAMMYGSQIRRNQATINCGNTDISNELVKEIINSGLGEFLKERNARYKVERRLDSRERVISKIRIFY